MTDAPLPQDRLWVAHPGGHAGSGLDRRSVLIGGAYAAGFALACQPISAATIATSGAGLEQMQAAFPAPDGFSVPVFMARPKDGGPAPIVMVVHEVFGVHEWVKDICRRFARAGYCAVAPDLFARAGDATRIVDMKALFGTIVSPTPDAQVMTDIDAAYAWAGTQGGDGRHRGITGFCWGGRIVWLYAAHARNLAAGVAFYGRLKGDPTALQPLSAINRAGDLAAPVLGHYGGRDKGISLADVEAMRVKLKYAEKAPPTAITVYPEAEHGFMADYRPSFDAASAGAAWSATLDWFGRYLRG